MGNIKSKGWPHRGSDFLAHTKRYRCHALGPRVNSRSSAVPVSGKLESQFRLLGGSKGFPYLGKRPCINGFFIVHLHLRLLCSGSNVARFFPVPTANICKTRIRCKYFLIKMQVSCENNQYRLIINQLQISKFNYGLFRERCRRPDDENPCQ